MSGAKPLILVLEDEKEISSLLCEELERAGMQTQPFHRTAQVLPFLERQHVNLMLLDVGLPDGTGFDVIEAVRRAGIRTPAIFLTANSTEMDKVRGLNLGADDYMAKPFSCIELIARIQAVLRRTETLYDQKVTGRISLRTEPFLFCGCEVIPDRLEIRLPDGSSEPIGKKELGILSCLVNNQGTVITRKALIHEVWGEHADTRSRSLDQYVVKIRNLLDKYDANKEQFRTIHGVGYFYEPTPNP